MDKLKSYLHTRILFIGTLFDLRGSTRSTLCRMQEDYRAKRASNVFDAMRGDWESIGKDMRHAIEQYCM